MSLENILIKNIIVDFDRQKIIRTTTSNALDSITLYKNTNYIIQATTIASVVNNTTAIPFELTDTYVFAIGDVFGVTANPVISIVSGFNDPDDWASVNPALGKLCWRIDTSGVPLSTDMGNASSKKYTANLWCFNRNLESVLIFSCDCTVKNVINFPV